MNRDELLNMEITNAGIPEKELRNILAIDSGNEILTFSAECTEFMTILCC